MPNEISQFVGAFEAARAVGGPDDFAPFLPSPEHPLYHAVLGEIIRIDLEYGWRDGVPRSLADYQRRFPQIAAHAELWPQIGFEEYRLRRQAGDPTSPEEYRNRFGAVVDEWPNPHSSDAVASSESAALPATYVAPGSAGEDAGQRYLQDRKAAERLARALRAMPEAGEDFLGFHLVTELGRGAFGRVYLAEQTELAGRRVALKISTNLFDESQTLAQLQHTNIVPIYSAHEAEPFQAVCMPYLGATTLASLISSFHERDSLPASGKDLVSTLNQRRGSTLRATGSQSGVHGTTGSTPPILDGSNPARSADAALKRVESGNENRADPIALQRLEGLTYVEAVLWLGARLADGLAHAHEHNIIHRDLKPANVLLADDGQPLLLDFNLSTNGNLRRSALGASTGGTLPYMAPEHLASFNTRQSRVDARSDLYSLGLILFEMLTGKPAFPHRKGAPRDVVPAMIADRTQAPPRLRALNRNISPAVEAIVRHCLEPDPARRYQTARELEEDLERQLDNRPLRFARDSSLRERARKWARRHPRLTSSTSVAVLALVLIGTLASVLVLHQRRLDHYRAQDSLNSFQEDLRDAQFLLYGRSPSQAQLERGIDQCRQALDRYQVLQNPDWKNHADVVNLSAADQQQLHEDVGEALFLASRATVQRAAFQPDQPRTDALFTALNLNHQAESCYEPCNVPRAVWQQRGELLTYQKKDAEGARLLKWAEETPLRSARDCYLMAHLHTNRGNFLKALPLLVEALQKDPRYFSAWFVKGNCHDNLLHHAEAIACYSTCIALRPRFHWAWHNRGLAHLRQGNFQRAVADFDQVLELAPDLADAYLNRGMAYDGQGRFDDAIADLSRALEAGAPGAQVYFLRAAVRARARDEEGAKRDRNLGMQAEPADEQSWVARGLARLPADPKGALADFDRALEHNPRSFPALQNKAHVFADHLHNDAAAVRVLDTVVSLYPDSAMGRAGRGVSLARLGKRAPAVADGEQALLLDTRPANLYQVGCIYALTSRAHAQDRLRAFELLSYGLNGGFGLEFVDTDSDLDPVRQAPEFRRIVDAARALHPNEHRP